jgi:flagellar assembly protein FliH
MSIDATFSRVNFPALNRGAPTTEDVKSRASGHSAGYAAGLRAAADDIAAHEARREAELAEKLAEGEARIAATIAVLTAASEALERRTLPVLATAQDAIAATAVELAEAIIGRELSDSETSALSALHRALADIELDLVQVVRLNPQDLEFLDWQGKLTPGVTFEADATLARGDAVTEFEEGYLDARVASALVRARRAILEVGE